ncbi:MAG TPA: hypothetical protein VK826_16775 [Bacteroidia bacterium]|nr:hypothetical protein [Bacteroidia bacterium]
MKKVKYKLDFEIDKLTRSIENIATGDSFQTEISLITVPDLKIVTKRTGWKFDWRHEFKQIERGVYKLTIAGNPLVIQGLISMEDRPGYLYMHLLESAPFNLGKGKVYLGVPGNLVAFACLRSFQMGNDGYISFQSKTKLIDHYRKSLGATFVGGHNLMIETEAATKLVMQYFKS